MDYEDEFVNTDDDDDFNRRFRLQSDSDMLHNINNANNLITSHPGRINNTNDNDGNNDRIEPVLTLIVIIFSSNVDGFEGHH